MGAFTSFLIKKNINLQVPIDKFESSLSEDPGYGFSITEIGEHKYKILGNFSIGTLVITGGTTKLRESIRIIMETFPAGESLIEVKLRSTLRIEVILTLVVCLILPVVFLRTDPANAPRSLIWILPFVPILFWFLYRVQEYFLLKRIEKYLATF